MKIKDLIENSNISLKTRVTKNGDRFNVAMQLDLSKEELLSIGLSEPKVKGKGDGPVEPTLKDIVVQLAKTTQEGFSELRKDNQEIHKRLDNIDARLQVIENTPTVQNEIKNSKSKNR